MRGWHIAAYIYLLTIFILWLSSHIVRYAWQNRPPPRMVYDTDIVRSTNVTRTRRRIPRIIHHIMAYTKTWGHDVPVQWNASYHSVLAQNFGEFEYRLWTDKEIHAFLQKHEPDFYKNTYLTYKYDMQRVDSFRYALLYHLGGIYIDMDNGCNRPFKDLLATLEALDPDSPHLAAFPRSESFGVETDLLVSTVGHPLYKKLISRLHLFNHYFIFHFWTILISAGPIYVSIQERLFSSSSQSDTVRVLDYTVFQPMFIWKSKGHTWVGKDASLLFYISAKTNYLLHYFKVFTILLIILLFIKWFKSRKRDRL
jgi:mannosyltransferase OCH1-like enzyme